MDYPPRIQELLEKYWKTETTVEEERELRNYFVLHPEHADQTTAYFLFLKLESGIESPRVLPPVEVTRRPVIIRLMAVAAVILLLITAGIFIERERQNSTDLAQEEITTNDSFEDPNAAYAEAKEALLLISQKLNASKKQAQAQIARATPYTEILK
ncbi:MAG: hypothetical protein R3301_04560 [Saprospiraceae bacterium]|nr:hypothetical protein [Saprospiraceae bacterium]